jgi:hypothetical protein
MGWNQGYTVLEAQTIALYDLGVLTPEVINALCAPFRNTDIDSGGSRGLRTKDGRSFEDILLAVAAPKTVQQQIAALKAAAPEQDWLNDNYQEDLEEQSEEYNSAQKAEWAYQDALYAAIRDITRF